MSPVLSRWKQTNNKYTGICLLSQLKTLCTCVLPLYLFTSSSNACLGLFPNYARCQLAPFRVRKFIETPSLIHTCVFIFPTQNRTNFLRFTPLVLPGYTINPYRMQLSRIRHHFRFCSLVFYVRPYDWISLPACTAGSFQLDIRICGYHSETGEPVL